MSRDPELAQLIPNSEFISCAACDEIIWQHRTDPITVRMKVPSQPWPDGRPLDLMVAAANQTYLETVTLPAEEACRAHMEERHRIRLWIWDRYGWDRVLRKWFW